jgi:hypothetical protein
MGACSGPRLWWFCLALSAICLLSLWPTYSAQPDVPAFAQTAQPSCRVYDDLDDPFTKEYGRTNLMLSRSYEGSGYRVRKFLRKLQQGKPVKIAVLGGSVSAGQCADLKYARREG